jgi:histidinol-phosphate aminotransferase
MIDIMNRQLQGLDAYVPGEQPTGPGWVKLNTNENAYPPAPEVIEAIRDFDPQGIRKYPNPTGLALREAIADSFEWAVEGTMITNGSDEGLRMLCHAFLNPGDRVGMLWPTYSLYPILGRMFGAETAKSPVGRNGEWPDTFAFENVKLFFLANPNPPYGTFYEERQIANIIASHPDVIFVIDAAYLEFSHHACSCSTLMLEFDNLFILQTFSKGHAMAGLRVGFLLGHPERMEPLWVVRDSYNVNTVSQAAALEAWNARGYYQDILAKVSRTRESTRARLAELGFEVLPSEANFVFARHAEAPRIFEELKRRKILVRYFDAPETHDGLRITIGTPEQMDKLFGALAEILG